MPTATCFVALQGPTDSPSQAPFDVDRVTLATVVQWRTTAHTVPAAGGRGQCLFHRGRRVLAGQDGRDALPGALPD